jgi:hypothetical protein
MPELNAAIVELNRRNRQFWEVQRARIETAMSDEAVVETALSAMISELERRIPAYCQITFEAALEHAERSKHWILSEQSRKGGKAKKPDALQELILDIARHAPSITALQLLERIKDRSGIAPLEDVDEQVIYFTGHDGRSKEARISGLKDRLSRAKEKLNSR